MTPLPPNTYVELLVDVHRDEDKENYGDSLNMIDAASIIYAEEGKLIKTHILNWVVISL